MPRSTTLLTAVALLTAASGATAQLVTPPPAPAEPEPEFVPPAPVTRTPPPRPQARPEPQPQPETDAAQPARPAAQPAPGRALRPTPNEQLRVMPYVPLSRPLGAPDDYDGPIPEYRIGDHYAALERNPLINDDASEKINAFYRARHARAELIAIENLGTLIDVDQGLLEAVSIENPELAREIGERIRPLVLSPNPTQEMLQTGLLTPDQAGFNNRIIRTYQQAFAEAAQRDAQAQGTRAETGFFQRIFANELKEAQLAVDLLAYEATTRLDTVLEGLDISDDERARLGAQAAAEPAASLDDRVARGEAFQLAWRRLSLENKQALLTRVIETREDPMSPPVGPLTLLPAGG